MDYRQPAIPVIEMGPTIVTFSQIVPIEQAHKYEIVLSDVLKGDWDAFDAMFSVELYSKRNPFHEKLPGTHLAGDYESYVFYANMPYGTAVSFMGEVFKN